MLFLFRSGKSLPEAASFALDPQSPSMEKPSRRRWRQWRTFIGFATFLPNGRSGAGAKSLGVLKQTRCSSNKTASHTSQRSKRSSSRTLTEHRRFARRKIVQSDLILGSDGCWRAGRGVSSTTEQTDNSNLPLSLIIPLHTPLTSSREISVFVEIDLNRGIRSESIGRSFDHTPFIVRWNQSNSSVGTTFRGSVDMTVSRRHCRPQLFPFFKRGQDEAMEVEKQVSQQCPTAQHCSREILRRLEGRVEN